MPQEVRAPLDVDELLRGIAASLRGDERYKGVSFEVLPGGDARVVGVSGRLESAFRNVMDNAASFSVPDGQVTVRSRPDANAVTVVVTDTGPGIRAEDLSRVFDRFFTTRKSERGTGLGLALVRAVVEAHGGTIQAFSDGPGKGATFEMRFPRQPPLQTSADTATDGHGAPA